MSSERPQNEPSQYFDADPQVKSSERSYDFEVHGTTIRISSDRGVFSTRGLDKGTAVLLRHLDVDDADLPPGDLVDLGCGAGPLALALAVTFPSRTVWAIDVNSRALDLTSRNARTNQLTNVKTSTPENFPSTPVAAIWSNPPIRVGKDALHDILRTWLARLLPNGRCRLVISKNLGGDSLQKWIIDNGFECTRLGSKSGFRILEVSHP